MSTIIERPVWGNHIKGKRAEVWFRRSRAAYDLAAIIDGDNVTEEEYEAAYELLASIVRCSLAEVHQWERANTYERYANSSQCQADEARLDKRRTGLQKRLDRYGLKIQNYGLYPSIVDKSGNDKHMLHYFD